MDKEHSTIFVGVAWSGLIKDHNESNVKSQQESEKQRFKSIYALLNNWVSNLKGEYE